MHNTQLSFQIVGNSRIGVAIQVGKTVQTQVEFFVRIYGISAHIIHGGGNHSLVIGQGIQCLANICHIRGGIPAVVVHFSFGNVGGVVGHPQRIGDGLNRGVYHNQVVPDGSETVAVVYSVEGVTGGCRPLQVDAVVHNAAAVMVIGIQSVGCPIVIVHHNLVVAEQNRGIQVTGINAIPGACRAAIQADAVAFDAAVTHIVKVHAVEGGIDRFCRLFNRVVHDFGIAVIEIYRIIVGTGDVVAVEHHAGVVRAVAAAVEHDAHAAAKDAVSDK